VINSLKGKNIMDNNKKIRVGSAVLIVKGNEILLGKRNKEPNFGRWVLPGGKIEFGETHQQAAVREAQEELGIKIKVERLAGKGIYHLVEGDTHRMIIYSIASHIDGALNPSSDISDAKFFSKEELKMLDITPVVRQILGDELWI
jgi:8-oxo-dGTP diphosphatase